MDPDLRQLRSFVAVAEELSFTHAAQRLHLAQQSLSAQIRRLEAELGVALFRRTSRRVELLPAGEALLEEARAILAASEGAVSRVRATGGLATAPHLDLIAELEVDPGRGLVSFRGARMMLIHADALGALREELISRVGRDGAAQVLFRLGFESGRVDLARLAEGGEFDDGELSALGPLMQAWEGMVHVEPVALRFDREAGTFEASGTWTNSVEVEQHLLRHPPTPDPVCWALAGYASGWGTSLFGAPLLAREVECAASGADACRWRITTLEAWRDAAEPYRPAFG